MPSTPPPGPGRTPQVSRLGSLCVLYSTMCLLVSPALSGSARLRCGTDLLADLMFVCGERGIYLGKGNWSGYGTRRRGKGIVDHCCRPAGCDLQHLEMYCGKAKDLRQQPTTPQPTTPQHTTLQDTTLQPTTPQHTTPQYTTPQYTTLQDTTTPQYTTLQDTTLQRTTPQHTTLQDTTLQPTTPQHTTLQDTTLQPTTPQHTTLQSISLKPTSSQQGVAQQFEAVFQKRLVGQLGPPSSQKRRNYRRKTQNTLRRRKPASSPRRVQTPQPSRWPVPVSESPLGGFTKLT